MSGRKSARAWDAEIASVVSLQPFETINAQQGAGLAEGIVSGTHIATDAGWRPITTLAVGDRVMTLDHGLRPVVSLRRAALWAGVGACPMAMRPFAVPAGALGNAVPMLVLPEQHVLVESQLAGAVFGDTFAMIPAASLEGYCGISRIDPHPNIEVIQLIFAQDEIVYVNGMGLIHCASVDTGRVDGRLAENAFYAILPFSMARALVAAMIEDEGLGARVVARRGTC